MAMTESAESLTALLNFIPMANQKLKALAERTPQRRALTAHGKGLRRPHPQGDLADQAGERQRRARAGQCDDEAGGGDKSAHASAGAAGGAASAQPACSSNSSAEKHAAKAKPLVVAKSKATPKPIAQAKPVTALATSAAKTQSPSASKTAFPQHRRRQEAPRGQHVVCAESDQPATVSSKTNKPAKTTSVAKDKSKKSRSTSALATAQAKPGSGDHYLRAQPVNAADLVVAPSGANGAADTRSSAADTPACRAARKVTRVRGSRSQFAGRAAQPVAPDVRLRIPWAQRRRWDPRPSSATWRGDGCRRRRSGRAKMHPSEAAGR